MAEGNAAVLAVTATNASIRLTTPANDGRNLTTFLASNFAIYRANHFFLAGYHPDFSASSFAHETAGCLVASALRR